MSKLLSIDDVPGPGLALLTVLNFGEVYSRQLWLKCKARKPGVCGVSGEGYLPGVDVYRPFGNTSNRSLRILAKQIDKN